MQIDKSVPPPPSTRKLTITISRLETGDSVFLPGKTTKDAARYMHLTRKLWTWTDQRTYASRTVEGGVRIWCTARKERPPAQDPLPERPQVPFTLETGVALPTEPTEEDLMS